MKKNEPFLLYLRKTKKKTGGITLIDIRNLLGKILPNLKLDFLLDPIEIKINENPNDPSLNNKIFNNPEVNLFFWCILSNRIEIAKIFWKLGKVNSIILDLI